MNRTDGSSSRPSHLQDGCERFLGLAETESLSFPYLLFGMISFVAEGFADYLSLRVLKRAFSIYAKNWIRRDSRIGCRQRPPLSAGWVYLFARRARLHDQATKENQGRQRASCDRAGIARWRPPVRARGIRPDGDDGIR